MTRCITGVYDTWPTPGVKDQAKHVVIENLKLQIKNLQ